MCVCRCNDLCWGMTTFTCSVAWTLCVECMSNPIVKGAAFLFHSTVTSHLYIKSENCTSYCQWISSHLKFRELQLWFTEFLLLVYWLKCLARLLRVVTSLTRLLTCRLIYWVTTLVYRITTKQESWPKLLRKYILLTSFRLQRITRVSWLSTVYTSFNLQRITSLGVSWLFNVPQNSTFQKSLRRYFEADFKTCQ